jgi:hypothetical protein
VGVGGVGGVGGGGGGGGHMTQFLYTIFQLYYHRGVFTPKISTLG